MVYRLRQQHGLRRPWVGCLAAACLAACAGGKPVDRGGTAATGSEQAAPAAVPSALVGHYRLDPAHSFVQFELMHFSTSTLRGRLGPVEGHVTLASPPQDSQLSASVLMSTVDTGVKPLDVKLAGVDFFNLTEYPRAWFVARDFRWRGVELVEVRGELTLKGLVQPVTLKAQGFQCRVSAVRPQRHVCGGDFIAELERSRFEMSFGVPFVSDRVRLRLQVEGWRDV